MHPSTPLSSRARPVILLAVAAGVTLSSACTERIDPISPRATAPEAVPSTVPGTPPISVAPDLGVPVPSSALGLAAAPLLADPVVHFEEAFDGDALDPALWVEELATGGKRWCATAGLWVDPALPGGCNGVQYTLPLGEVTVGGGLVSLRAPAIPSPPYLLLEGSPFPGEGDFQLDLAVRHDALGPHGTGIRVMAWEDTSPEGANDPLAQNTLFLVWADSNVGIIAVLFGRRVSVPQDGALHHYRMSYIDGAYYMDVDGETVVGPFETELRPTALWMGNPLFTDWGSADWTDFSVDFIRVNVPAPPPAAIGAVLDLWPGSCESVLNTSGRGVVPAAIPGAADFDPAGIDPASILLEGVAALRWAFEDVGGGACDAAPDGVTDLTLKFDRQALVAALGELVDGQVLTLSLTGALLPELGGTAVEAQADITVKVPAAKAGGAAPGEGGNGKGKGKPAQTGDAASSGSADGADKGKDDGGPGNGKGGQGPGA